MLQRSALEGRGRARGSHTSKEMLYPEVTHVSSALNLTAGTTYPTARQQDGTILPCVWKERSTGFGRISEVSVRIDIFHKVLGTQDDNIQGHIHLFTRTYSEFYSGYDNVCSIFIKSGENISKIIH